jgi:kynureninase
LAHGRAINFVATANMTVAVGATPVLVDIAGLEAPVVDPADVKRRVTARSKALVVMHYGGYVNGMAEIQTLCREHGLALVEDACHAVGARPVVSVRLPAYRGTFAERCFHMVEPGDPGGLANAIVAAVNESPTERAARLREARRIVEREHDEVVSAGRLGLYRSLLGDESKRQPGGASRQAELGHARVV